MTAVSSTTATIDPYVNGLLQGTKWAVTSLTFSFPASGSYYGTGYGTGEPSKNFEAFTSLQQQAARAVLQSVSAVSNLKFVEVTETATLHGELRYAESDAPSTAWSYYPSSSAIGGDAWFNNSSNYYENPIKGNYAYYIMLHETGHSLGLKHAHDAGAYGAVPSDRDSVEYTVMSYRSYVGGPTTGMTNGASSYPQSFMMYDIAALQHLYGANYTTHAGDTTYRWDPNTGQMFINGTGESRPAGNKVFLTIWDGGGRDTYDFSNYASALDIDLRPGEWSTISTTQLAVLGSGRLAAGNIANALLYQGNQISLIENAYGGAASDILVGNAAANWLRGGGGNDTLTGGLGMDLAIFSGASTQYGWQKSSDGSWRVSDMRSGSPDGVDTLWEIEQLRFSDLLLDLAAVSRNSAPVITSAVSTGRVTEWGDKSAAEIANTTHIASGSITFSDVDALDTHTASFAAKQTGYLGVFSLNLANIGAESLQWAFSVADSAIDFLRAGQTLTQAYDISIGDGHGGFALQTVTLTITGADDASSKKGGKFSLQAAGPDVLENASANLGLSPVALQHLSQLEPISAVIGLLGDSQNPWADWLQP